MTEQEQSEVQPVPRADWLQLHQEAPLEPDLPIIDAHHHFLDRPGWRYGRDEMLADVGRGHNIRATVHIEAGHWYRTDAEPGYAPVGETEHVNAIAEDSRSGRDNTQLAAGMVGYVDLRLGNAVREIVEAHRGVAGSRLKGVRNNATFHRDPAVLSSSRLWPEGLLADRRFRQGLTALADLGLAYDTFIYHSQIDEVADLARAAPSLPNVLDHVGGPLGIGPYEGKQDEVYARWRGSMENLARIPNVFVKLGGLGMRMNGFHLDRAPLPPTSDKLASLWAPFIVEAIELFGSHRCMFESNFPIDQMSCDYVVLWNAYKKMAAGASESEKAALFFGTAQSVYDLSSV